MTKDFRRRLRDGETLIGAMLTLPTVATAEILADVGFDWFFVDGEHGPLDSAEILGILQAVGDRVPCVVRVPAADEAWIKRVLDMGADGIIVPQVNTAQQAADVVRFSRYAPAGSRGVGLGRAQGYGMRFAEYVESANERVAVIVQAEHADAVENIEQIVQVLGIDAIQLGPYDLSASLGKMGQINDPVVTAAIDRIVKACDAAGMIRGNFGVDAATVRGYIDQGYTLLTLGVDTLYLGAAAKNALAELR